MRKYLRIKPRFSSGQLVKVKTKQSELWRIEDFYWQKNLFGEIEYYYKIVAVDRLKCDIVHEILLEEVKK